MSSQPSALRITIVGLVSLAIAMGIGRFAFTPLFPMMQENGLASISDGGVLASVHFLGYLLGAVFAARLRFAPTSTLRFSLIAIAVCTLGMGLTNDLLLWLVFRWLCGVFSATTLMLVSNYYVKHLAVLGRPENQGWVFAGVGAGIAVAGLGVMGFMLGSVGSSLGWRIMGALSLVAVLAVCLSLGPEIPRTPLAAPNRASQRTPLIWSLVIAYGATGLGYIIPATYLPVMAREIVQSPIVFGWSWPVFGLAAFVSTPLVVMLRKQFSNRQIWAVSQFTMAVGLILPVAHPHIVTIIVAGICVGGTFMIITMMGMTEAHRLAPPHDVMRHIGAMTTAFASGQIIGPVFAGFIHDLSGSFSTSLLITSVILIVTALVLIVYAPKEVGCEPVRKAG